MPESDNTTKSTGAKPVRVPPLFDWRDYLALADAIIARVNAKIDHPAKELREPSPGLNLTPYRDDIARLLAELEELYMVELGDYEMRNPTDSPAKKLEDNPISAPDQLFGYGADAGAGWEGWDEIWRSSTARPRGNPGHNRIWIGGPPIKPLHSIYGRTCQWWQERSLGRFHPTFFVDYEREYDGCVSEYNAPARFLLCIIQTLDPGYTIKNARGLYETMRKKSECYT